MKLILPSRLTFWRWVFTITGLLPFLAIYQLLSGAPKLGVDLSASLPWQGLIAALALVGLLSLCLLALTFSRSRERALSLVEVLGSLTINGAWMGIIPIAVGLVGFTILFICLFFLPEHKDITCFHEIIHGIVGKPFLAV